MSPAGILACRPTVPALRPASASREGRGLCDADCPGRGSLLLVAEEFWQPCGAENVNASVTDGAMNLFFHQAVEGGVADAGEGLAVRRVSIEAMVFAKKEGRKVRSIAEYL